MATPSLHANLISISGAILAGLLSVACAASTTAAPRTPAPPAPPGPSTTAATTVSTASTTDPAAPVGPPGPGDWDRWSHDQKRAYMRATVLHSEREAFAGFEPVRYARLNCTSCHGAGAADGSFQMPNPGLPKLADTPDGFRELFRREPQVFAFMADTVVPETAKLLGVKPFDMASHTGFRCFQCHTKQ